LEKSIETSSVSYADTFPFAFSKGKALLRKIELLKKTKEFAISNLKPSSKGKPWLRKNNISSSIAFPLPKAKGKGDRLRWMRLILVENNDNHLIYQLP